MAQYSKRYGLDEVSEVICLLVMDIRHQGRATSGAILAALQSPDPVGKLLELGASRYPSRITALRREINALTGDSTIGGFVYSEARGEFVLRTSRS